MKAGPRFSVGRSPKQEALNSGSSNLGQYLDNLKSSSLAKLQRQTQSNDTSSKYVQYHQGNDFNVSSFNGVHGSLRNRDTTSCILLENGTMELVQVRDSVEVRR